VAGVVEHRHDQRAVEVFVAALAQDADFLQARADVGAGQPALFGQAQAQRAVGVAESKTLDQFRMIETA
jgi:hypothetical protein